MKNENFYIHRKYQKKRIYKADLKQLSHKKYFHPNLNQFVCQFDDRNFWHHHSERKHKQIANSTLYKYKYSCVRLPAHLRFMTVLRQS